MSTYVEIHCDVRKSGHDPRDHLSSFCWSDRNDNAQGWSVVDAKRQAREQGWVIAPGDMAACPNCAGKRGEPFFYPEEMPENPAAAPIDRPCRDGCDNPDCCPVRCCGPLSTHPASNARLEQGTVV